MIPKIIHFAWFSGEDKPPEIQRCLDSWKVFAPEFEIREWNAQSFPWQNWAWTRQAFQSRKWAFVTDFFRVWVVHEHGGVYLDSDVELRSPLNPLLNHDAFFGLELKNQLGAHAFGAVSSHPFVAKVLEYYKHAQFLNPIGTLHQLPMPIIMTRIFTTMYGCVPTPGRISNMEIYPENILSIDASDRQCVALHRMFGSWLDFSNNPYSRLFLRRYLWNEFIDASLKPYQGMRRGKYWDNLKIAFGYIALGILPHILTMLYLKKRQSKRLLQLP